MSLQTQIKKSLNDVGTKEFYLTSAFLTGLILLSVAIIPAHFLPNNEWALPTLTFLDRLVVSLFTLEYFLRIWATNKPFRYIFSFFGIIDLLAILPFYLSQIGLIEFSALSLLLRILRVFKFGRMHQLESEAIKRTKEGGSYGLFCCVGDEKVQRVIQQHPIRHIFSVIMPLIFFCSAVTIIFFSWIMGYAFGRLSHYCWCCFVFQSLARLRLRRNYYYR